MGSDLFLAWSEHWPEVQKVRDFVDKRVSAILKRETVLTSALCSALSRLAERKGLEKPRHGYDFPLKYVRWEYTTPHRTIRTSIETLDWEKSTYAPDGHPDFIRIAQRIEHVQKLYHRRYFACCHGSGHMAQRWVDTELKWLGVDGYLLRGWYFDYDHDVAIGDIVDIYNYYSLQDWDLVLEKASHYLAEYDDPEDAPWALSHIVKVAKAVLASGQPEKFAVIHSF